MRGLITPVMKGFITSELSCRLTLTQLRRKGDQKGISPARCHHHFGDDPHHHLVLPHRRLGPGGGVGFPAPPGLDGLIATLLVTRASMALRAPVLFVKLRSATRPVRFGRVPQAGYRRGIRRDIVGSRGGASCLPFPRRSVFLRHGRPSGNGQRFEPTARVGQENASSGAIGSMPGFRSPVRSFVRPRATTLPTVPGGSSVRNPDPVHGHPPMALETVLARQRRGTAGEPAQLASCSGRCPISLSRMWLAAFKMMPRSVGRQGCGQLLVALAALADRRRSRQNFSSALRAPLTLRRFPGAFSFQQQPTREESP